jgi:putative transcriptional regulator
MIEVLRNKNLTTKFQILVEIANGGPDIQQWEIARKLEITPQAVSDYISQLIKEKMLVANGRSSYRVTNEGVDWVIKTLRDLSNYSNFIQRAVNNISVCAAIAEETFKKNQKVGLRMKDGLLCASSDTSIGATGTTISIAAAGDDIGIRNIEGIVPLDIGNVIILKIPNIERGGSRKTDYALLKNYISEGSHLIIALGLEAFVALRKTETKFSQYGAIETTVESAKSGLNSLIVCVENETSELINRLEKEKIRYKLIDAEKR